ncbi:AN1-type zinc finger protein 1-like [Lingula anatina]|uniref:AN1-type zinc finger protein 1-like n=1 Tax=Lingula anatina TaxID=7574 RepID=A0A1S3HCK3_LINAN|nr:AN1-type zinc finger protein 1-like [Lingula anatina]|eukprot:XP_013383762.1 AN1-type zinc finger protein 1-like [Lingula anatina]
MADNAEDLGDVPLIGEHCEFPSCGQLDFLSFECTSCSKKFCKNHKSEDAHSCTKCNVSVSHPEYTGPRGHHCTVQDCTNRELTPVVCPHCHLNFCLSHRHQVDHDCPELRPPSPKMAKTAEHVKQIVESQKSKPVKKQGAKSRKTAAKVALMKMKMKAVGDKGIPETEKVYIQVLLPQGNAEKNCPMYFSKKWTIGRIVDKIAEIAKLKNDNNVAVAKKLRLFDAEEGVILPMDASLDSLMAPGHPELTPGLPELCSGSSVIIEYVDNDCSKLEDVTPYSMT